MTEFIQRIYFLKLYEINLREYSPLIAPMQSDVTSKFMDDRYCIGQKTTI